MNPFECESKVIFWNFTLRGVSRAKVAIFLAKKLPFTTFLFQVILNFKIFEKNIALIYNFESGKIRTFLHFEKHGHLGNRICQVPMFLDFWFSHFPCKLKIINGRGSDAIWGGNNTKTPLIAVWLNRFPAQLGTKGEKQKTSGSKKEIHIKCSCFPDFSSFTRLVSQKQWIYKDITYKID